MAANNFFLSVFIITISVFSIPFGGCRHTQPVTKTVLKHRGAKFLLENMRSNELCYEWLSARGSATIDLGDKSFSFGIKLRMKKDSVIWMTVSPLLGIEAGRIMITPDSVKIMNKVNSTYMLYNFDNFGDMIMADISFELLQSLLIGNSMDFSDVFSTDTLDDDDEKKEKLKSRTDGNYYLLSTMNRRKTRKSKAGKKVRQLFAQNFWLDPFTFKIVKSSVHDFSTGKLMEAKYEDFIAAEDTQTIPGKVNFRIISDRSLRVELEFSKVTLNIPQEFPFSIPQKYEAGM